MTYIVTQNLLKENKIKFDKWTFDEVFPEGSTLDLPQKEVDGRKFHNQLQRSVNRAYQDYLMKRK